MSDSVSYNTPGATENGSDAAKLATNEHSEGDGAVAGKTAQSKAAARTFVTLDVKPWGMLVGTNTSNCH